MIVTKELRGIPMDWEIKPFKSVIRFGKGLSITKENLIESGVQCLNYGEIHSKFPFEVLPSEDPLPFVSPDYLDTDEKSLVRQGDIVFADTSEDIEGVGNFTQIMGNEPIFAGYHTVITRPASSVNARYLAYILESEEFRNQIRSKVKGVKVFSVTKGILGNARVWFPDTQTQAFIASYLDAQTKRIDSLVNEKQNFITLLKEKRQALISHYVTKGIDDNVPMKDSGVEWIGEVPEHWEVARIKQVVSTPVTDGPHETPEFLDSGIPFISAEAISSGYINFDKKRGYISSELNELYSKKYTPKLHDIYMIKSGATTGVTAIVETEEVFNIWSPLAVVRCDELMEPYYVLNFMRSYNFLEAVELNWSFGTQQNIGMKVIENLHIAMPPKYEQLEIANHLKEKVDIIDKTVAETRTSIELLKEHRTALISAAVTGKIDVRDMTNNNKDVS